MENVEGDLSFDFEEGLKPGFNSGKFPLNSKGPNLVVSLNCASAYGFGGNKPLVKFGSKGIRPIVCRHWLRGLCMKGDSCEYVHQYDKSRMPICRNFAQSGVCHEQGCDYKHGKNDEINECFMYYVCLKTFTPFA